MRAHLRIVRAESSVCDPVRPIRVVLADNHAAMRRSLHLILDGEDDIRVVAEAADIPAVMRHLADHRPHVLVLDLGMHNGSSIEVIDRLRRQGVGPRIVVLTMDDAPAFARRAIAAGATGFVLKDRSDVELPQAVREAACGRGYVSGAVRAGPDPPRHEPATAGPSLA
jgi:two-component system, NarL family, response regulator NreC